MRPNKFTAGLGLLLVVLFPGVAACVLMCSLMAYRDFSIIQADYFPYVMKIREYGGSGEYSNISLSYIGIIHREEKILVVEDSEFDPYATKVEVFYTPGKKILLPRKIYELVLDKAPYRRQAVIYLLIALSAFPIWFLLYKYLTNPFKTS